MKKLLFIFALAGICTVATASFKPFQSAVNESKQLLVVSADYSTNTPEDVKKDEKKKNQPATTSCCPAKAKKTGCTEAQKKNCEASKANCSEVKECPKK